MCHLIITVLIILKNESTEQNLNVYKMVRRHQVSVGSGSRTSNGRFVSSERLELSLQPIKVVVVLMVRLVLQTAAVGGRRR